MFSQGDEKLKDITLIACNVVAFYREPNKMHFVEQLKTFDFHLVPYSYLKGVIATIFLYNQTQTYLSPSRNKSLTFYY